MPTSNNVTADEALVAYYQNNSSTRGQNFISKSGPSNCKLDLFVLLSSQLRIY